jgi:hypothetical protein
VLFGCGDGARRVSAVVRGIFHKRGFCDVAASAGWLLAGL